MSEFMGHSLAFWETSGRKCPPPRFTSGVCLDFHLTVALFPEGKAGDKTSSESEDSIQVEAQSGNISVSLRIPW